MTDEIKKGGIILKSGDIFQSNLDGNKKGYFQFLYKDDSFLAGHLIRAFSFNNETCTSLEDITSSSVAFYGFTRVFEGLEEGYWTKIGNTPIESTFEPPTFKCTKDTKFYVEKSDDWYIWKGDFAKATKIGEMTNEYKDLPDSVIVSPESIIEWLKAGRQVINYSPD
ncbi:hypothetical protein K8Q96_00910 [Candidatus Nomurabacteria bacterium]|nr:hypothetical protein [Candidatus Nomurabacteria bacterium]